MKEREDLNPPVLDLVKWFKSPFPDDDDHFIIFPTPDQMSFEMYSMKTWTLLDYRLRIFDKKQVFIAIDFQGNLISS